MDHTRQLREDAAVFDFVARLLADRERGAEQDLAAYQALFPEFAERIAAEHAAMQQDRGGDAPAQADRRVGPYRLIEQVGQGGQGIVFKAEHQELRRTVALKMLHTGLLGLDGARRARLRREAITVARLDHPGICPVYEVELDGPHPYLAMRFVAGRSLAVEIERARRPGASGELPPQTRAAVDVWAGFFERAALALHAAHQVGIVHRDIKPHNLMRTPEGEPVLLDFGLARDATSTSGSLTGSHELFGTLAYMAPELLSGRVAPHPSQDVYALGATLYEVLTLQQPFAAATREALWRRIESGDVARARELNPHLPRDLELIIAATAMERDPLRRYATALALAEDLRRVRQHEPILARPLRAREEIMIRALRLLIGGRVRLLRWTRRHPATSVALLLLTIGLALALTLYAEVARGNAELLAKNRQLSALQTAHHALTRSEVDTEEALRDVVNAAEDLDAELEDPEVAGILAEVLDRCFAERIYERIGGGDLMRSLAASRGGEFVAVPTLNGMVGVLRPGEGPLVAAIPVAASGRTFAVFGGQPERLLTAGDDGTLRAYELPGLRRVQTWTGAGDAPPAGRTTALAVSADGRFAARGDETGSVDLDDFVDLDGQGSERAAARYQLHGKNVSFAAFDPSGTRLLTFSKDLAGGFEGDGTAMLLECSTGARAPLGHWPGRQAPYHAAWSPDGAWVAIAHSDGAVRVLDAARHVPVERFQIRLRLEATWVAFDPVRPRLWTCSNDGLVVYDCTTGREWQRNADFGGRSPNMICFGADGAEVAVTANDATARIFDAETLRERRRFVAPARSEAVCWAAGGTRVLTATSSAVTSWFAAARPFLPDLIGHTGAVVQVQFDPTGTSVLTASADGTARLWDAAGAPLAVLPHGLPVRTARFAGDGHRAVTTCDGGPARVWQLDPPQATTLGPEPASDAWFFDQDRRVVTVADDGWLRLYEPDGRQLAAHQAHPPVPAWDGMGFGETRILCTAWHPTRPWLATGAGARVVSVFDCVEQREVFRSEPWPDPEGYRRGVYCLAFSPDGDTLVSGCADLWLHGWSLTTGQDRWTQLAGATPGTLVFLDDGAELLASARYSAAVWSMSPDPLLQDKKSVYVPRNVASALRVDASGRHVLCADKGGRLAVFATDPWRQILTVRASTQPLLDAAFSPDGDRVVTGDAAGRVRIWPVDPLPIAERAIPPRIRPGTK